jgi:hypothetical protein
MDRARQVGDLPATGKAGAGSHSEAPSQAVEQAKRDDPCRVSHHPGGPRVRRDRPGPIDGPMLKGCHLE